VDTLHINLYGGHGVGKSSTAAEVFAYLRGAGCNVAMTTDMTKRLYYTERLTQVHPFVVVSDHMRQQMELEGRVEVVLCDNPPLIDVMDMPSGMRAPAASLIQSMQQEWICLNIFLDRRHDYHGVVPGWGTACQANWRHERVREFTQRYVDPLIELDAKSAVAEIVMAVRARSVSLDFTDGALSIVGSRKPTPVRFVTRNTASA
jgi:hypothetical protein